MKHVFVAGSGRSSGYLINYLLEHAEQHAWQVTVGDYEQETARQKISGSHAAQAVFFDVHDDQLVAKHVAEADLVVSMLPAHLHIMLARACLRHNTHLLTASYVSQDILALDSEARQKGLLMLMEAGLDPGIDHMTVKQEIDQIQGQGGELTALKSFAGGLVAPESDNNPWHYKFTWNPRNVVKAGQGTVKFIRNGRYKYIPYHRLFTRLDCVEVKGYGAFDGYANRDSLKYRPYYGIDNIPTILRGTLRRPGFCQAWQVLVQLGITDDSYVFDNATDMTYRDFVNAYLPYKTKESVEEKICALAGIDMESETMQRLQWLGLFEQEPIGVSQATPAEILQQLLEKRWQLQPDDKDMIVMQHQFEYRLQEQNYAKKASMVTIGEDSTRTAMAKTVGVTLGIVTRLMMQGHISQRGVRIPVAPEIYEPVLKELESWGLEFIYD